MGSAKQSAARTALLGAVSVILAWPGLSTAVCAQPLASAADVFKIAAPSVGRLVLLDAKGAVAGTASAFVVGDGLVATNYHCLVDEEDGWAAHVSKVELPGHAAYTAEGVVAFDKQRDWAILKIPASGLRPLRTGDASKMEKGETVIAIGYPVGLDARPTSGTFSGWLEGDILHDASTSSGNSGGPLLDRAGKAIGITRGELKSTSGLVTLNDLFFAVDIKHIQAALSQRTSALTRLPLALPQRVKVAGRKGEVAGGIRVGEPRGGPGKAIVLGVLGAGAVVGGTVVLAGKAVDSLSDYGEIAQFSGIVAPCSYEVHQFQVKELVTVDVDVRSMSPGSTTLEGYGFVGACNGPATFRSAGAGKPNCGSLSELTQLGGCSPLNRGAYSVYLNNLPPGTHTIAVHNRGDADVSYALVVKKLFTP